MTGPQGMGVLRPMTVSTVIGTLQEAIEFIGDADLITYHTLRGTFAGGAGEDLGYAGMDLASLGINNFPNTIVGPDGLYLDKRTGTSTAITGAHHADLIPTAAGSLNGLTGLTVGFVFQRRSATPNVNQSVIVSLANSASPDDDLWFVGCGFNQAESDELTAGLVGSGINYFTRLRETNNDIISVNDQWFLVIARFGPTTTSTPRLRVMGGNITGVTATTGTMLSSSAAPLSFGHRGSGSGGNWQGALGHVFTIKREITDEEAEIIETAAIIEGWFENYVTSELEQHPDFVSGSASPPKFIATFAESVTGITAADFIMGGTAGATGCVVTGSGSMYTVTATGMTGAGTVTAKISGLAGVGVSGFPTLPSNTVSVDWVQPASNVDTYTDVGIDGIVGLFAHGDKLIGVCNPLDKLVVFDITDRENIVLSTSVIDSTWLNRCTAVCAVGNYAFVSSGNDNRFSCWDITTSPPTRVGTLSNSSLSVTHDIKILTSTKIAVPALNDNITNIIDVSTVTAPGIVESVPSSSVRGIGVHEDFLAVTQEAASDIIILYNAANPLVITELDQLDVTGNDLWGIDMNDYWLVVSSLASGGLIQVVNIQDPTNIFEVTNASGSPHRVLVEGNYCFTAGGTGLRVFSLEALPGSFILLQTLTLPQSMNGVDDILTPGAMTYHPDGYLYMASPGGNSVMAVRVDVDTATVIPGVGCTINKASGQSDPVSNTLPILFDVEFDEPVVGFGTGDVTLTGTAVIPGTTTGTVTEVGPMDGTTYRVSVTSLLGTGGTVNAFIHAGVCFSEATGYPNAPSTFTDNTVTITFDAPTVIEMGNNNSTSAGTTLVITTTQSAAVGDKIVVAVAADNAGSGGASSIASCADSAGNTYVLGQTTNRDPGAANEGVTHVYFSAQVSSALSSGGTITITFSPSTTCKAAMAWRCRPVVTGSLFHTGLQGFGQASGATTAPSCGFGSRNVHDILIGSVARESNVTPTGDADSTNGSWSAMTTVKADTGTSTTSIQIAGQTKVVTASGTQSFDVTAADAADVSIAVMFLARLIS